MVVVKATASPILKTTLRTSDSRQQLMLSVRLYRNDKLLSRFNYYVSDYGVPVYLLRGELKGGTIVNHPMSIRYNELISFLKRKIQKIAQEELTTKTVVNRELIKDLLSKSVKSHFNSDFISTIGQQKVRFTSSGFNKTEDELEVDQRAITAVQKMEFSTEPTIDPLGQVELNELDAGDIENLILDEDFRLKAEAEKERKSKLTTEEKYKLKEYDQQNIFELFGSIYYEPKLSSTYHKIVIRLFEYRLYMNPSEHVRDYNEQWVTDFFTFLWIHGYTHLNTKSFDPLKFKPEIFTDKPIKKYKSDNLYTLFEIVQRVSNFFADKGLIDKLNFKSINLKDICGIEQSEEGSRGEHSLDNLEFNKLFFFIFQPSKLAEYQSIMDSKKIEKGNGKIRFKNLKITIADLENARDLFCLQTMAGGIRGYKDLMTLKFSEEDKQLSFNVKKEKNRLMVNPFNVYTSIIAKDHGYILPKINFPYSGNSMETIYRMLCQTISEIIPFQREVLSDNRLIALSKLFNPYFARKTFSQIMSDEYEMDDDDIMKFTGHKSMKSKTILRRNYLNKSATTKKRKLFAEIKLPKGKTSSTKRSQ